MISAMEKNRVRKRTMGKNVGEGCNYRPKDAKQNSKAYDRQTRHTTQHRKIDNFLPKFKMCTLYKTP